MNKRINGVLDSSVRVSLRVMDCWSCGIVYALPEDFSARRLEDGAIWYCPNGHPSVYADSEVEKLKKRLGKEQERTAMLRQINRDKEFEIEHLSRSRAAVKGQLTKVKNRVSAGVCPCCNRHFANLGRHMKGQHPQWLKTETL